MQNIFTKGTDFLIRLLPSQFTEFFYLNRTVLSPQEFRRGIRRVWILALGYVIFAIGIILLFFLVDGFGWTTQAAVYSVQYIIGFPTIFLVSIIMVSFVWKRICEMKMSKRGLSLAIRCIFLILFTFACAWLVRFFMLVPGAFACFDSCGRIETTFRLTSGILVLCGQIIGLVFAVAVSSYIIKVSRVFKN